MAASTRDRLTIRRAPLIRAGVVLGIGVGGFFDGIVFHQLLQWHHVVSTTVVPTTLEALELNTLADGLFHTFTYIMVLIGLWLLFRATGQTDVSRSPRVLVGAMLGGFGLFNLVEGTINHQILQIHHLRPGPNEALYDLAFLASGVILMLIGTAIARGERVA
jgi:uncharacterized membrane protein